MSVAETTAKWQKDQAHSVARYKPAKPEIPNDNRCPIGDTVCTGRTPPPPGSINEGFSPDQYPREWLLVLATAAIAFILLTRR